MDFILSIYRQIILILLDAYLMRNKTITAIKFDMGGLPVKGPDEPDYSLPSRISYTKEHRRRLDIILERQPGDKESQGLFHIEPSFPFCIPKVENNEVVNESAVMPSLVYESFVYRAEFMSAYGKLTAHDMHANKEITMALKLPKDLLYYKFYSMDKDKKIHETKIYLKYRAKDNITKFTVFYDDKIKLKLDTNGNYSFKNIGSKHIDGLKIKGNLLSEKNLTLYIDKEVPVRISAETADRYLRYLKYHIYGFDTAEKHLNSTKYSE